MNNDKLQAIDITALRTVCGGQVPALPAPLQAPRPLGLPAPIKPLPGPPMAMPPSTMARPPSTMAPPKYSAGWWDAFRAAGLGR